MGLLHFFLLSRLFKKIEKSQPAMKPSRPRRDFSHPGNLLKGMTTAKIPYMIEGLGSRSELKSRNCYLTLRLYTGHNLGPDPQRWRDWYEVNKDRPPHEWWADRLGERGYNTYGLELDGQIEATLRAMDDSDPLVRRAASRLLSHLTGTAIKFDPGGTPKLRKWQKEKWMVSYEKLKKAQSKKEKGKGS